MSSGRTMWVCRQKVSDPRSRPQREHWQGSSALTSRPSLGPLGPLGPPRERPNQHPHRTRRFTHPHGYCTRYCTIRIQQSARNYKLSYCNIHDSDIQSTSSTLSAHGIPVTRNLKENFFSMIVRLHKAWFRLGYNESAQRHCFTTHCPIALPN